MRKIINVSLAIVIAVCFGLGVIPGTNATVTHAGTQNRLVSILSPNFGDTVEGLTAHNIAESELSDYTPYDSTSSIRMSGKSYMPALVGEDGKRHVDASFNVDPTLAEFDATTLTATTTALQLWVNFNQKPSVISRGITITLSNQAETNVISWVITTDEIKALTARDSVSGYDVNVFGTAVSNTPVGWVKLTLPVVSGAVTGDFVSDGKLDYAKCSIVQTGETGADQPLGFYDLAFVKISTGTTEKMSEILNYTQIIVLSSADISKDDANYYVGELFPKFMSAKEVFSACWVGDTNYLAHENISKMKVMTDTGVGSTSTSYYAMGASDFLINHTSYTIAYGFMYQDRFVSIINEKISATDYGMGVWIDSEADDIVIGETKRIYFTVHDAFKGATIKFESTDADVLEIKEVNIVNKYLVVEAHKKGTAGIKISVTDDRLEGTEYEATGIINEEFEVDVVKATKKANTTVILLWVGLGMILVGLIYLAVRAIIDARKIEIK